LLENNPTTVWLIMKHITENHHIKARNYYSST